MRQRLFWYAYLAVVTFAFVWVVGGAVLYLTPDPTPAHVLDR